MSKKQEPKAEGQKEKKVKVVYYDDGSTVADMSGTRGKKGAPRERASFREKAATYFGVVKKLFLPMLCTLAAFTLIYIILLAITGNL